jgi:Flp pilus assembly protein TadD
MKHLRVASLALMLMVAGNLQGQQATDLTAIERMAAAGEWQTALKSLDERIANNTNDVEARFLKGLLLLERGDTDSAREVFVELSRLFPRIPESFNNLATIYAQQGDYEQARQALLNAIANAPEYPVVRANLGDLYTRLATEAYREAINLDPGDEASKAKLNTLEKLFAGGG